MGEQVGRLPVQGIAVPSAVITLDTLRPLDDASLPSVYTQAGGAAGDTHLDNETSKLELQLTGGQSEAIDLTVVRAGLPGSRPLATFKAASALSVVYRFASEAEDDTVEEAWRGRAEPTWLNDAAGLIRTGGVGTLDYEHYDVVVSATSHDLVAVYVDPDDGGRIRSARWDHDAWAWSTTRPRVSVESIGRNPDEWLGANQTVSAVALPDGSILAITTRDSAQFAVFLSEDYGETWEPHSRYAGGAATAGPRGQKAAYYRGDILLIQSTTTGGGDMDLQQYVSSDLGASWRFVAEAEIGEFSATTRGEFSVTAGAPGVVVGYLQRGTGYSAVRVLASAGQPLSSAAEVVIASTAAQSITVAVDETGSITAHVTEGHIVACYVSVDGGATWALSGTALDLSTVSATFLYRPVGLQGAWWRGRFVLLYQWFFDGVSDPDLIDGSIGCALLAGWSNLCPGIDEIGTYGEAGFPYVWEESNPAVALPDSGFGWTHTGGTDATIEDPGEIEFAMIADNGQYFKDLGIGVDAAFFASVRIVSGTPSTASNLHGIELHAADGVDDRAIDVRIGAAEIAVYDHSAATLIASLAIDCTRQVEVYACVSLNTSTGILVVARYAGDTRWTVIVSRSTLATSAGAVLSESRAEFGAIGGAVTVVSRWRMYAVAPYQGLRLGLSNRLAPPEPIETGGRLSVLGTPLPDVGTTERVALLSASRGPGIRAETARISPVYDYALDYALPRLGESPDRPWRTTSKAEQVLVFDLGSDGGKLGLDWLRIFALLRANFRTAYLERSTDGSSWTTADTWDGATGFAGLTYVLQGRTIRPTTGTAAAGRPLARGELAGCYAIVDGESFEIESNSSGLWVEPSGTTKWAEVTLAAGSDLSGVSATGTCTLVLRDGVHFGRFSGASPTTVDRFWRVRIPADQVTPWGFYQVGKLFVGTPTVFGKRSSRGWQWDVRPNIRTTTSRYGTIRKRQDGPPARRVTLGWADGEQRGRLQAGVTDADYVRAGTNGPALALRDDVWSALWGLLEEVRSGEVPVIALLTIPAEDVTITDRSLFVYGSLEGGPSFGQIEGREGGNAFGRVDPITVDEIR